MKVILSSCRVSPRRHAVLELVSQGLSNKEIARQLSLSEAGVKKHVSWLMQRFGVANRAGLVRSAIEEEIIQIDGHRSRADPIPQ